MTETFVPINDLERALLAAQEGTLSTPAFFEALLASKVLIMIDKDCPDGVWDNSSSPLILKSSSGLAVVAMFTAMERTSEWHKRQPRFSHGFLADFSQLLQHVAPHAGIVINPGSTVGVEISPSRVADLKQGRAK
jgi:hypothetical protein